MTGARAPGAFDMPAFAAAVHARVRERNISYRQVGRESGVCEVNITQRLRGGGLSADTFVRLLLWLGETDVTPYVNTAGDPVAGPAGAGARRR